MPGSPRKEELAEAEVDDTLRRPVKHQPVEEQRAEKDDPSHDGPEHGDPSQQVNYQEWLQSQHDEHQHSEQGASTDQVSSGGRRSPKDTEGPPQDPELSSLSALSNFSTGLSVSSNLCFQDFLSSVVDHVQVDSDADSALGDFGTP
jgi:hypothetical protein